MELGYIRVSTFAQHTDRQLADLKLPAECLYVDHSSGSNTDRPELQNLLKALREGDVVHIHSLDRLARNLKDLMNVLDKMLERGVTVHFHKENLVFSADKNNSMHRLMLQIFGGLAEWELALVRERQAEGIAAARRKGKKLGRPSKVTEAQKEQVREAFRKDPLYSVSRISRESGVPRSTCHGIREQLKLVAQ